uniref:Carbamoyl phosphate synthase small chain n=1 Tax=Chondria tumulosa TaxID=2740715 RepID=A0A896SSV7_9FLOR|nr:carbamoyl phosphate synthase small subunit [Chondria tumulosa]QSD57023.1 carbamoyl phosphate synthase small subunit [Chondria tumulosa]
MSNNLYPAILNLQDGTSYKGWSFFKLSFLCFGEIVFNTGMTGYQEIFTDPSYSGQMVVFTYPEIGNTGLNVQDNESTLVHIKAVIAKNISYSSSNYRSVISLKDFFIQKHLPHIFGIDTRSLAKHIRSYGVMNAVIFNSSLSFNWINFKYKTIDEIDLVCKVTTKYNYYTTITLVSEKMSFYSNFKAKAIIDSSYLLKIVIIDFGVKLNILRKLLCVGCTVFVLPVTSDYETIMKYKPNGIILSNGPGNPLSVNISINTVKRLISFANIPIFGICMGHQILNLALGAKILKLKFGHRGLNHPSGCSNYSEITSQNHGFTVDKNSVSIDKLSQLIKYKFFNLNDLTISSSLHKYNPIFSVQYHPEANPGPRDSDYLFNVFVELVNFIKSRS